MYMQIIQFVFHSSGGVRISRELCEGNITVNLVYPTTNMTQKKKWFQNDLIFSYLHSALQKYEYSDSQKLVNICAIKKSMWATGEQQSPSVESSQTSADAIDRVKCQTHNLIIVTCINTHVRSQLIWQTAGPQTIAIGNEFCYEINILIHPPATSTQQPPYSHAGNLIIRGEKYVIMARLAGYTYFPNHRDIAILHKMK